MLISPTRRSLSPPLLIGVCIYLALALTAEQAGSYNGQCVSLTDLQELPAGHWCEVPNSRLRDTEKKPQEYSDWDGSSSASYNSFQRQSGITAIIQNWSGGAFDTTRDRLIIFGGGHNGYGGNEIYGFNLNTLRWERITDPTTFPNRHPNHQNPDGTPVSRHTYSSVAYIEHADRFFAFGGAPDSSVGVCGTRGTWTFDFTGLQWQLMTNPSTDPPNKCDDVTVYDPVSKKVFYHQGPSPSSWHSYDFDTNTWQDLNALGANNQVNAAVDPIRRVIIEAGGGVTYSYDLSSPSLARTTLSTSGSKTIENGDDPGIAYDPVSDRIIGWAGGADVYTFNIDTNTWVRHTPASTNVITPPAVTAVGGVFGRFRYSPNKNVFVTVNHVDENVFIYRHSPGGTQQDPVPGPPAAPKNLQTH